MIKTPYKSQSIGHLGILEGILKKIKFKKRVDKLIPISLEKGAKATMGERVIAMIYNGLGFIDNRLYVFSKFLQKNQFDD